MLRHVVIGFRRNRQFLGNLLYFLVIFSMLILIQKPELLVPFISPFRGHASTQQTNSERAITAPSELQDAIAQVEPPPPTKTMATMIDLPFLPKDYDCEEMLHKSGRNFSYNDMFWDHADAYKSALSVNGLVQHATTDEKAWLIQEMSLLPFVRTVCETGFDAGRNTFNWLVRSEMLAVYSFDEASKNYSAEMADFMMIEFTDRFYLYPGDTTQTILEFAKQHQNDTFQCDAIFIDAVKDTETIKSNMEDFRSIANRKQNIVVVDAHPNGGSAHKRALGIWQAFVQEGKLRNYFRCDFERLVDSGFQKGGLTVGSFSF